MSDNAYTLYFGGEPRSMKVNDLISTSRCVISMIAA
jgi:hypothetical protein